ncbi:MAG: fibronectin type III domain-containing protein [Vicinamibacterales bacterium]
MEPPGTGGPASSCVLEAGSAPGLANLANTPVTSPGFVAGGIPSGVYYVRVRAINAAGPGAATPDVTVVVP